MTEAGDDSSDLRKLVFPNLRAYINFTVTAVNIVGDGENNSIVSEPCEHPRGGKIYNLGCLLLKGIWMKLAYNKWDALLQSVGNFNKVCEV